MLTGNSLLGLLLSDLVRLTADHGDKLDAALNEQIARVAGEGNAAMVFGGKDLGDNFGDSGFGEREIIRAYKMDTQVRYDVYPRHLQWRREGIENALFPAASPLQSLEANIPPNSRSDMLDLLSDSFNLGREVPASVRACASWMGLSGYL